MHARDGLVACERSARRSTSRTLAETRARGGRRAPGGPHPSAPEYRCSWEFETQAGAANLEMVAGVDEVGRGALCGPVFAGAVILGAGFDPTGIDDSKRLPPGRRESLATHIRSCCRAFAIGAADVAEIDRLGIVPATHLAMRRAVGDLVVRPDLLLVDGLRVPDLPVEHWPIVKGDARSFSIAAASIVAKVARDKLMEQVDREYPGYGLARNKGYGTAEHRQAIVRLGPAPIHRRAFLNPQWPLFAPEDPSR